MIAFEMIQTKSYVVFVVLKFIQLGHMAKVLDYPNMNLTLMLNVFLNSIYLGFLMSPQ